MYIQLEAPDTLLAFNNYFYEKYIHSTFETGNVKANKCPQQHLSNITNWVALKLS